VPWSEVSTLGLREEFVMLAGQDGVNVRGLCRRYRISPTTGYKWLGRYAGGGREALADRSRRPHSSPGQTATAIEAQVVELRDRHPAWGARKLHRRLQDLGAQALPAISTLNAILARHGRLDGAESAKHKAFTRFEHAAPNDLWQMDFKGHFALARGRCHPLTVIDDHSRFAVGLRACADEQWTTVQAELSGLFRRFGLPRRLLADNGAPWGDDADTPHTRLTAWLLRLDVPLSHGRPYHPQTQGKAERFHRSLLAELVDRESFTDLVHCQCRFDAWRHVYNVERPHQAIDMAVPLRRYQASPRPFPEHLPAVEYDSTDIVRAVDSAGRISFRGRTIRVGKAFQGYRVALRPTDKDGCFTVCFRHHPVASLDLNEAT
jgi:transposase InsO family protein